ncbi:hypothetical protein BGX34_006347, partial [Mortierella sp. NVP85]
MEVSSNNSHAVGELSALASSSSDTVALERNVASLRIGGTDDNSQALIMGPGELSSESESKQTPTSISSPLQLGAWNNMAHSENLHPLQLQMEELVGKIQQTDQKMDELVGSIQRTDQKMEEVLRRTQQTDQQREHMQQMQDQISQILQTLQQMNRQHIEEVERITQQLSLHRQQLEESQQTSQQKQQQQIEAVQQKLQQLDQDSRQQIQDIRQQTQQQIGKAIIDVQGLNEQTKHSQQQSLQQMLEIGKVKQEQDHLSPELRRQKAQQAFNQLANAKYLVQAVLAKPSHKSTAPRLFIILPGPISVVDRQGGSPSIQFRLYFLCECGSHTTTEDCNTQHEVHLADHPGYDLKNQDEFINKYGSYLLSMMYMVKKGTKKRGLVVPPLLGFNHTTGEGEGIGQLVNDTITHLKGATGYDDRDSTANQSLDVMKLAKLRSHLKIKVGEGLTGGL